MKCIGIIILAVFLLIILAFIMVDVVINGKTWVSRIKIGRWQDVEAWEKEVRLVGENWLLHTPVIKKTDQSRLILKDILCNDYRDKTIQSWQAAGLYLGLTEHPRTRVMLRSYEDRFLDKNGHWLEPPKEVDGAMLAYAILRITVEPMRVRPAMDQVYELILDRVDDADGCVCYRKGIPKVRFVDTIGFVCPFLVCYGQKYHVKDAVRLACLQIKTYTEKGMLKDSFLPVHAYHAVSGMPMGVYGWGRGTGWYMLGLVDLCQELDDENEEKASMLALLKEAADNLVKFQGQNGGYSANICIGDRQDSSITAIAAYFYQSCYYVLNDGSYQKIANGCIKALMGVTRRSGAIDFSQGDTKGLGHYSQTFDVMPFTQGMGCRLV